MMLRAIMILSLLFIPMLTQAQSDLYQLSPNEYSMGVGLGFQENSTTLSGGLNYGIHHSVKGFLGVGFELVKDPFTGTSIPPAPIFTVGIGSIRPLGKTGLDYVGVTSFGIEIAQIIDKQTDAKFATMRVMAFLVSGGVAKKINTQSGLTLMPIISVSHGNTWVTTESDILGFSETESDSGFSGQIALDVGISPNVDVIGSMSFSFETSDMAYGVYLSYRPHSSKDTE